jgi:3-hydroxyisobutyrate dehydrogenase-like beta-hydroxyacid dehydrogenase
MITQNSTVGFIGLGAMGQRMAHRLLNSGFKPFAYDQFVGSQSGVGEGRLPRFARQDRAAARATVRKLLSRRLPSRRT